MTEKNSSQIFSFFLSLIRIKCSRKVLILLSKLLSYLTAPTYLFVETKLLDVLTGPIPVSYTHLTLPTNREV